MQDILQEACKGIEILDQPQDLICVLIHIKPSINTNHKTKNYTEDKLNYEQSDNDTRKWVAENEEREGEVHNSHVD